MRVASAVAPTTSNVLIAAANVGLAAVFPLCRPLRNCRAPSGVTIVNSARNGARWRDVRRQIAHAEGNYSLMILVAGSNDVFRMTSRSRMRLDIRSALKLAGERADTVAVVGAPNVRTVPALAWPLSTLLASRQRILDCELAAACSEADATYVDLYTEAPDDPIRRHPKRFYAADGLHPNAAGQAFAYSCLRAAVPLGRLLGAAPELSWLFQQQVQECVGSISVRWPQQIRTIPSAL